MGGFVTNCSQKKGFTLIELLVVMAIIGILASIVTMSVGEARKRGNDSGRKVQIQEILKAAELYYLDHQQYPLVPTGGVPFTDPALQALMVAPEYLRGIPEEPERYYYCSSGSYMLIAVNTEVDKGITESDYCYAVRGSGPNFGCTYQGIGSDIDADDLCSERF